MIRKLQILSFIFVFGFAFCLTNGFADEELPPILDFPTAEGPEYIQGNAEIQRGPDRIIGSNDFEKMQNLPRNSQDYQLGTKVGWFFMVSRNNPNRGWICTGFLVGPDLFMTNHHCIHDNFGLLPITGARIFMDYYQDLDVDPTRGGLTARVTEILRMDGPKDYALLRLDSPIGNTYGWLELDTETRPNTSQSVKLISHPDGKSKEIVRRNSEIVNPSDYDVNAPHLLGYLADSEGGSSGSPVFLREGTGVIAIHHTAYSRRFTNEPLFNAGTLMSYIVPEIRQWLPRDTPTITFNPSTVADQTFTVGQAVRLQLPAPTGGNRPYNYTLTPRLPAGLYFDPVGDAYGLIGGTPIVTMPKTRFTYTATDAQRASASLNFTIEIRARGTPTITFNPSTVADQTFTVGSAVSLNLPVATGGTAPYTYSLSGTLPIGLRFDPLDRWIGGTPIVPMPKTRFTYTATDATRASASLNFTIEILEEMADDPSDVNGDGEVTVIDLAIVAIFYGTQVPAGVDFPADVNDDGRVNIPDLIAVAAAIDAAGNAGVLPPNAIAGVLEDIAAGINALEAVAEAPGRIGISQQVLLSSAAYQNVATAFADAKNILTDDARLQKWMPLLKELLHLLAEKQEIPDTTALLPNYPNPFNPETWIPYHLAQDADVRITIHNVRGVLVRELTLGYQPAGVYENRGRAAYWDGRNEVGEPVASGLYFYTLSTESTRDSVTAGEFTATRKLLIAK